MLTEPPEPVAIVGMACRFAGGIDSLDAFWSLLRQGGDVISDLPPGRWRWYEQQGPEHAEAVRGVTRRGAYLDDISGFDADFFGIVPREAALMDPQQRIMLELAWEALEHAGIPPRDLASTDTGVFIGIGADDYGRRLLEDLPRVEAWTGIGGAYCAAANRISYTLDLHGPSMAVDTACSSSLVGIHLAVQALRARECPVALAGGVLVIAAPGLSLVLDAAGATAPDGRCKSFDANADGYGRGEGGGMIVLKLLRDARRDGDRVLAVIRGSGVYQDGRTNGIMAPSGPAQAHLLCRVYAASGIDPSDIDYVEAHGTGTPVGDPLECEAMGRVLGAGRDTTAPLLIGSVKPNIGHLEAGAGVAGVIKTVLAMGHGEIPPSLNVSTPNPAIDWANSGLRVATRSTPWPDRTGPRRAGVSAYGYGGTIAHVILEAPDATGTPAHSTVREPARGHVFPLSGASEAAVRANAARLADRLATDSTLRLADMGHTLGRRRSHLPYRCAVSATDREELAAALRAVAAGETRVTAMLPGAGRGLVWVFSGHGSQWTGMGRGLLAEPAFAAVVDEIEPIFVAELGVSPRRVIGEDNAQPVDVLQPMIFAIQVALAATWRAHGIAPHAVIGHSVGEIAAAVAAGVLSLEQGATLVCRRSALLRRVAGRGAMAMVSLPAAEAERRLGERDDVSVAVASSTGSAVLSGDIDTIARIGRQWSADGVLVRPVDSDVAFHSPQMDPLLDDLMAALNDLAPIAPTVPLYTTALDDPRSAAPRDGAYWAANLRGQVRFDQAVRAAIEDGYRLFLEVSGHPVVEHSIVETLAASGVEDAFVTHSLRRNRPERETLLHNLGQLYEHGAGVAWSALWPDGRLVDLPSTAWQRRPHWAPEPSAGPTVTGRHDPASHTLLGGRVTVNGTTRAHAWLTRVDRRSRPYPGAHPVRDIEIVPAAVLLNTFLAAAAQAGAWSDLTDVALRVPVSLTRARDVQVVLQDGTVKLSSRIVDDSGGTDHRGWVPHTIAAIEPTAELSMCSPWAPVSGEEQPDGYVVDRLAALGVAAMGLSWRIERLRSAADGLGADVTAAPGPGPASWAPLLDAVLSMASVAFAGPPTLRMPAAVERVGVDATPPHRVRVEVRVVAENIVDVQIVDPERGRVVGLLTGLRYGVLDSDVGAVNHPRRLVHETVWIPAEPAAAGGIPSGLVLVGDDSTLRRRLVRWLAGAGAGHRVVPGPEQLRDEELTAGHTILVVPSGGPAGDVAESAARGAWLLARTAQRIARVRRPARLWCVTQRARESRDERALGQGTLWGLGRIVGGEHPDQWGGIVDIGRSEADLPALFAVLAEGRRDGEDVIVVRSGRASVSRLRALAGEPTRAPRLCRPDATYLVTGGLGALGLEVTHWLADRGARRIVLAGRRALPPRDTWDQVSDPTERAQVAAIRSLERRGITVVTVAVDVADGEATAKLLNPTALGLPPIRGVVHAAGVLDSRPLHALDEESLRTVLRPKVQGALVLHALYPPGTVDFFVLFSSCGYLLGLPGQASYAAGNAFLDALAAHRRAAGDRGTTSFGWTSWRGLGMSTSSAVIDAELAVRGVADVSLAEAFGAWELADRHDLGHAVVLRRLPTEPGQRQPPLLSGLAKASAVSEPRLEPAWSTMDAATLHGHLVDRIRALVAAETRMPQAEVDPRRAFAELGMDSVMTVRIRRELERALGLALPATLFWDRPTTEALAALLTERLTGDSATPPREPTSELDVRCAT